MLNWKIIPSSAGLLALSLSPACPAQELDAMPTASADLSLARYIVALRGGPQYDLPLAERQRGLSLEERAVLHELDVDRRRRECADAVSALLPRLVRLGGNVVAELPMFQACVVDCPRGRAGELATLAAVAGVWADSVAPAHARAGGSAAAPLPSDPRPVDVDHHRAAMAHEQGFTGAGSATWAPVAAVLDGWLLGQVSSVTRHHAALHVGGNPAQPTRVLADLDWSNPATPLPTRPLPAPAFGTSNLYHGVGIAGVLAGAATSGPGLFSFAPGHAPGAGIVGVNILASLPATAPKPACPNFPTDPSGFWAYQSQVLAGLNEIAAKRLTYSGTSQPSRPILVANLSYGGPTNPAHVVNDALRRLAWDYDILPVTSAGNSGGLMFESLYNLNGIAVGAYEFGFVGTGATLARPVAPFTSTGPQRPGTTVNICVVPSPGGGCQLVASGPSWCLAGGDSDASWSHPNGSFGRTFPDLGAIGGASRVLFQDNESIADPSLQGGTSVAAPHVSGAALLFACGRDGLAPATIPTALETRAVLLATPENRTADGNGDNTTGAGFLRTDRVTYASAVSELTFGTVMQPTSAGTANLLASFHVTAGDRYAVAIAWFADASTAGITAPNWMDADLVLTMPDGTQISGADPLDNRTWERLEFTAPRDGRVDVEALVQRVSSGLPHRMICAFATCCIGTAATAPGAVAATATSAPTTTCGVARSSAGGTAFDSGSTYAASLSSPPWTNLTFATPASLAGPLPDGRWLALRLDNAGATYNGPGSCAWTNFNGNSGLTSVGRVELLTNSPVERVVPCALLSGSATHGVGPNTTNRWNGFLRIPAGAGTAVAEFHAILGASPPSTAAIHWFAAQIPADVNIGYRRVIGSVQQQLPHLAPGVSTCTPGSGWFLGAGMFCNSLDGTGATWAAPTRGLWYDIHVFAAGPFVQGSPTMAATSAPSLTRGAVDLLLGGNEQQNPAVLDLAMLIVDTVPGESNLIQAFEPTVNGTCVSLFKAASLLFSVPGAYAANAGTTMNNPLVGASGRIRLPLPADPLFLGAPFHFQALATAINGSLLQVRPTNIVTVTFGL
jgi:hypothetical protein